ncbi:unnamed protein product [Heligmosomoides polygyrus]|uniref:Peptidase S1 domain-containing protein n=1 Tax=Heligmosomoides polygyrus TaxID=6339 RepID=A0A183G2Z8_HELPZ|nr:unnamed protein product [Heligmosomoides polygyrus]
MRSKNDHEVVVLTTHLGSLANCQQVACHEDFDECTFTNDIAVVELEEDVNSTAGIPICMPGDSDQVQKSPLFISSAFGQSRGQKGKHKTPYHVLRNYYLRTKHKHIHTAVPPKIRICESDMGGPLFNKGETSTLMGIASHGNTCDENVEGSDQDPWDSQISADDSPWNDDEKWDMCELKYVFALRMQNLPVTAKLQTEMRARILGAYP